MTVNFHGNVYAIVGKILNTAEKIILPNGGYENAWNEWKRSFRKRSADWRTARCLQPERNRSVLISPKVPQWMSYRGKVAVWVDVRVVRAEAKAEARVGAKAEVVTADQDDVHRRFSIKRFATTGCRNNGSRIFMERYS